jgi:C-terminal processing protease CtpA/Prc
MGDIACGTSVLTESATRATAAASLFGTVAPGTQLDVRAPSGKTRTITVPDKSDSFWTSCVDPWKVGAPNVEGDERSDGVVVLKIRRFRNPEAPAASLSAEVRRVIAQAHGKPLVIDVRGNQGGLINLVQETLGLLPGMSLGDVAQCSIRGEEGTFSFGVARIEPTDPAQPPPSRVVVLTDGLAFSAGDVFPLLAQRLGKITVVGTPSQGELNPGATSEPITIGGPLPLRVTTSASSCTDDRGTSLAGTGATMDDEVELDPVDVARGIDTQLEAAAAVARRGPS